MKRGMLAVALTAVLGAPAAAQAQGTEPNGLPVDIKAIQAIIPVREDAEDPTVRERALEVYRALIPRGLEIADEPRVGVWLAELSSLRGHELRPQDPATKWMEGAIELRVRHGDEEGWFPIHYPVTGEFWYHAGRYVGLPKLHATASIARAGDGWRMQASRTGAEAAGGPPIELEWHPGPADDTILRAALGAATDPLFVLNAPMEGPKLDKTQYSVNPPYEQQTLVPGGPAAYPAGGLPAGGAVRVRLRGDLDAVNEDYRDIFPAGATFADVVDLDQVVPGGFADYAITIGSASENVGEGGYDQSAAKKRQKAKRKKSRRARR